MFAPTTRARVRTWARAWVGFERVHPATKPPPRHRVPPEATAPVLAREGRRLRARARSRMDRARARASKTSGGSGVLDTEARRAVGIGAALLPTPLRAPGRGPSPFEAVYRTRPQKGLRAERLQVSLAVPWTARSLAAISRRNMRVPTAGHPGWPRRSNWVGHTRVEVDAEARESRLAWACPVAALSAEHDGALSRPCGRNCCVALFIGEG